MLKYLQPVLPRLLTTMLGTWFAWKNTQLDSLFLVDRSHSVSLDYLLTSQHPTNRVRVLEFGVVPSFHMTSVLRCCRKLLPDKRISQKHLDTIFHAPTMSKVRNSLDAWSGFLTQTQKGMINAFLRRMYKYSFVGECSDRDAVMDDTYRRIFFKLIGSTAHRLHSLLRPVKSNPYQLLSRNHNFQ